MRDFSHAITRVIMLPRQLDDQFDAITDECRSYTNTYVLGLSANFDVPSPAVYPLVTGGYNLEWREEGLEVRIHNNERVEVLWYVENSLLDFVSQDFDGWPDYKDLVRWTRDLLGVPPRDDECVCGE